MAIMQMCPICPGGLVWMETPSGLACGECGFVPKQADHNIVDEPEVAAGSSSHMEMPEDAAHPAGEQHQKFIEAPGLETEFQRKGVLPPDYHVITKEQIQGVMSMLPPGSKIYGSQASGKAHQYSDLDVKLPKPMSDRDLSVLVANILVEQRVQLNSLNISAPCVSHKDCSIMAHTDADHVHPPYIEHIKGGLVDPEDLPQEVQDARKSRSEHRRKYYTEIAEPSDVYLTDPEINELREYSKNPDTYTIDHKKLPRRTTNRTLFDKHINEFRQKKPTLEDYDISLDTYNKYKDTDLEQIGSLSEDLQSKCDEIQWKIDTEELDPNTIQDLTQQLSLLNDEHRKMFSIYHYLKHKNEYEASVSHTGRLITESDLRAYARTSVPRRDTIGGLDLVIEWDKGQTRSGKDREGNEWHHAMHADYGYIHDTEGEDGEGLDVYVGPDHESDKVFIIEQLHDGEYDEDKCMIGFDSADEAEDCYRKHFPEDGAEFFGGIREMLFDEFATQYLDKNIKHKERYRKRADIGQSLVTITEGEEDSRPVDRRDVSEAYHDDNISEDKDIHLGMVEVPYSSGHGPLSIHEDDPDEDKKVVMQSTASLGCGLDPYRVGAIYSYSELIPQHQHEIDINWKKKRGRHLLWLRTAVALPTLVKESQRWYLANRNRKWGFTDSEKVVALAEIMLEGGIITPLLVSPIGEKNGGVWEGYHRLRAADMMGWNGLPVIMKIDPTEQYWQEKVAEEKREPWICVDLDGTILEEDPNAEKRDNSRPPLGEPYQGVADEMRDLMNIGRVSIYTARQYFEEDDNGWQDEIKEHLAQHKIPFDDIYVGKKPPADVFIDNKNVRFEGEWAGMADMIRGILTKQKYREKPHHEISMEAAINIDGQMPPAHVIDKVNQERARRFKEEESRRQRVEIPPPPPPPAADNDRRAYASASTGTGDNDPDAYTDIDSTHKDDLAVSTKRLAG